MICYKTTKIRNNLFRHIKIQHKSEIKKLDNNSENDVKDNSNSGQKEDCGSGNCRKFYGLCYQNYWCKKCKDLPHIGLKRGPKPKIKDPDEIQKPKEPELCTECGKYVIGQGDL